MRYVQGAADDGPSLSPVLPGASSGTGLGWLSYEVRGPDASRPDRAGWRACMRPGGAVYLVDPDGYRRRVPDRDTYGRLFRDSGSRSHDPAIRDLPERPPLARSTMLVRGDASDPIYLFDCGRKRRIASGRVMDKYGFDGARVFVIRQTLLDHVACGDEWS
jgi:hypothetical protein